MLAIVEKNTLALQQNCSSVTEEVDEISKRLSKALKDRTEFLRGKARDMYVLLFSFKSQCSGRV